MVAVVAPFPIAGPRKKIKRKDRKIIERKYIGGYKEMVLPGATAKRFPPEKGVKLLS